MLMTCQDCGLTWKNGHNCKASGKKDGVKQPNNGSRKTKNFKKSWKSDFKENRNDCFMKEDNNNTPNVKDKQRDHRENNNKKSSKQDEAMKEEANALYKEGRFKQALIKYTELIHLYPTNANNYSNRSACHMMMEKYENALNDARKTIEIDPTHIKAHVRFIKCALSMGKLLVAETALSRLSEVDPKNEILATHRKKLKEIHKHLEQEAEAASTKQYNRALIEINKCLAICSRSNSFKIRRAEYLAHLRRYKEAEEVVDNVLQVDPLNIDAKYVVGFCVYQSEVDRAVNYIRETLQLVPDHKKLVSLYKKARKLADRKKAGNDAIKRKEYSEALGFYAEAMAVDIGNLEMKKKLYYNMALAQYKLGNLQKSIDECSNALVIDPKYVKALMRRGRCYMDLKDWEEAVKDLTRACKLDSGKDCKKLLDEAKQKFASSRSDHHSIIGVPYNAPYQDIKRAYKQKALVHHPDRHSTASHEEQKRHEKKFKEITQAYRILMKGYKQNGRYRSSGCDAHYPTDFHDDRTDEDDEDCYGNPMSDMWYAYSAFLQEQRAHFFC
uniref:DNAJC7_3 protein n=1 Tax=Fopius arisanus TaxID=64838 RepID=A0A0C9RIK8_9HYME